MSLKLTFGLGFEQICSYPPMIANGRIENGKTEYVIGDEVSYECTSGYSLHGGLQNAAIRCEQGPGDYHPVWQGEIPSCSLDLSLGKSG